MLLKKEIYVGHSVDEFHSITGLFNKNGIKYFTRTDYHNHYASIGRGPGVGRYATKSSDPTYYVYVQRKDYGLAQEMVSGHFNSGGT